MPNQQKPRMPNQQRPRMPNQQGPGHMPNQQRHRMPNLQQQPRMPNQQQPRMPNLQQQPRMPNQQQPMMPNLHRPRMPTQQPPGIPNQQHTHPQQPRPQNQFSGGPQPRMNSGLGRQPPHNVQNRQLQNLTPDHGTYSNANQQGQSQVGNVWATDGARGNNDRGQYQAGRDRSRGQQRPMVIREVSVFKEETVPTASAQSRRVVQNKKQGSGNDRTVVSMFFGFVAIISLKYLVDCGGTYVKKTVSACIHTSAVLQKTHIFLYRNMHYSLKCRAHVITVVRHP